ncbi:MAG: DNA primase [Muribaculaceae bacterium]|nr:DNA primase [Muribaculaceae bacterium]
MKRIDQETKQRILDAADIVEVVSDFVTLKRRGANYIGLCPFHNERTPSFSVSKSKGICKCFSCGKGGSPVNFLMELEQMSFNEALRYLAKKYNIEIKEHELSDAERQQASQRENMFAVNDFAKDFFNKTLTETTEGQAIGLAYFRQRGISDAAIQRFQLGFAPEQSTALYDAATSAGYNRQAIIDTGLCSVSESGRVYDRFRGRVIYPVQSISGKTVAFGGRTLRSDKQVAKYVNSPESIIYSKSRELYGLYQAKNSIAKKDKCILVEGYMDVISMSQRGVENVVASSGTSLTQGQITLIHRFTSNVTVIYDSDAAGIKASLRGIDMLLAEGLDVKVVLLPDGDDPDSFAQSHTAKEVEQYIATHETDFIRFKTRILMQGLDNDPRHRAEVITDIVKSISVIPNDITRTIYIQECSQNLQINENSLALQVAKFIAEQKEQEASNKARRESIESIGNPDVPQTADAYRNLSQTDADILRPVEREIIRYIIRYGVAEIGVLDSEGNHATTLVIDYLRQELSYEKLSFQIPVHNQVFELAMQLRAQFDEAISLHDQSSLQLRQQEWDSGQAIIAQEVSTLDQIKSRETALQREIDSNYMQRENEFRLNYISKALLSNENDEIRKLATELSISRHKLSKVHSKYAKLETEQDRLEDRLPQAIFALKDAHVQCRLISLRNALKALSTAENSPIEEIVNLMRQIADLDKLRSQYAKYLGERVVAPK